MVEGIGEDFLPPISDFTRVKKAYRSATRKAFSRASCWRRKASSAVLPPGPRSPRVEVLPRTDRAEERAHLRLRHRQQVPVEDVQRLLDAGQRFPRTAGARRPARPDPASLPQRDTVVVGPKDLLVTAYQRMKLYDVSQLPVVDGDALVGIVDESDVLLHVRRRGAVPRPGLDRDGPSSRPPRREIADRGAVAGVRPRATSPSSWMEAVSSA